MQEEGQHPALLGLTRVPQADGPSATYDDSSDLWMTGDRGALVLHSAGYTKSSSSTGAED